MNFTYLRIVFCASLFLAAGTLGAMERKAKNAKRENKKKDLGFQLVVAAKKGDLEQVNFLLEAGAPVDYDDGSGRAALHWTVWNNFPEIMRALIKANADVNQCLPWSASVLQVVIYFDRSAMLPMIIAAGADIRFFINCSRLSPLNFAACFGRKRIAELLVEEMLCIPDELQTKRICVFMNCLKRNYAVNYSNFRHVFKKALQAMIKEENVTNPESFVRRQVDRFEAHMYEDEGDICEQIQQHLLNKYFRK